MKRMAAIVLLFGVLFWTAVAAQDGPFISSRAVYPQNRSYHIGDVLKMELAVKLRKGAVIVPDSLPQKAQRINDWIEVRDFSVIKNENNNGVYYEFVIEYQVMPVIKGDVVGKSFPIGPETKSIPAGKISFSYGNSRYDLISEEIRFVFAPLTPSTGDSTGRLHGNIEPRPLDMEWWRWVRWLVAAVGVFTLLLLVGNLLRNKEKNPFFAAGKEIDKIIRNRAGDSSPENLKSAFRIFHRAIDRYAGRAIFSHNWPAVPEFNSLPENIGERMKEFFSESDRLFYGSDGEYDAEKTRFILRQLRGLAKEMDKQVRQQ